MHHSDHRGFTLLELIIIVGILGVIMLVALPPMSRFIRSNRLAGSTNTVAGDLRYARSLASTQRRNYEFRSTATGYSIVSVTPASTVLTRSLQPGVQFTAVSDTAHFDAFGPTKSKVFTLQKDGHSRVVSMNATGQVTCD